MVAALAEKIPRATSTVACSNARCASSDAITPAATAARRSLLIGLDHVRGGQVERALQLERRQLRVFPEQERADPRDVRRREAVPGRASAAAAEPRDLDVDPAREELHRR